MRTRRSAVAEIWQSLLILTDDLEGSVVGFRHKVVIAGILRAVCGKGGFWTRMGSCRCSDVATVCMRGWLTQADERKKTNRAQRKRLFLSTERVGREVVKPYDQIIQPDGSLSMEAESSTEAE